MYLTPAGPGSGAGGEYFNLWSSGAYCPDDGPYGSMAFCNGGDADYWGTEVYKFSIDRLKWERCNERATGINGVTASGGDPNFDESWGEHSGQPSPPHTYDQVEYLPPELGGGKRGSFLFPTRTIVYRYWPFYSPHAFDLDSKAWRRASATTFIVDLGFVGSSPSWAFDKSRGRYWGLISGGGPIENNFIWWMDFADGIGTGERKSIPSYLSPNGYAVSRVWPEGDMLLVVGHKDLKFSLDVMDLKTLAGYQKITLTGDTIPASGGYGFAYLKGKFYIRLPNSARQSLWEITPGRWVVREITMAGEVVADKTNANGMYKRLMAVEALGCLMWVDDINGPVYAYGV